jgi:DNA primase
MADQVEEVKAKTDIVSLISEYVKLKKAGRNYKALCPFHSEKTPSFMVSPELQIFKCFGCSETGDAITFLQKNEGMEFYEALKFLADRAGVKLKPFKGRDMGEKDRFYQINSITGRFYNYVLLNHPKGKAALKYLLRDRGLKLPTIKKFQIGYSPDAVGALTNFLVNKKGYKPIELEKVGLIYGRGGRPFDRFRGRIIFPLTDHLGNIRGFAGRTLPGMRSDLAKYINSPETSIYQKGNLLYGLNVAKDDIKSKKEAVVVEGELDMISSWQIGVKNIVAIKGTALTKDQLKLLRRFAEKVTLALDSDIAGDVAARRGIETAEDLELEVKVARMRKYKDPDEAARLAPDKYRKYLKQAIGIWDFVIDSIFSKADITSGSGKARVSREIVPVLASINDNIVQAHYIEMVSRKMSVPTEAVAEQVEKFEKGKKAQKISFDTAKESSKSGRGVKSRKGRRELLEERFLSLAFNFFLKELDKKDNINLIKKPLFKRILEEYRLYSKGSKKVELSEFISVLPKELVNGFAEVVLQDTMPEDKVLARKEIDMTLKQLKGIDIKEKLKELAEKIKERESKGSVRKLRELQKEFAKVSSKIKLL